MLAGEPPLPVPVPRPSLSSDFRARRRRVSLLRTTVPEVVDQVVSRALARAPSGPAPQRCRFLSGARHRAGHQLTEHVPWAVKRPAAGRLMRSTRNARLAAGTLGFGLLIGAGALFAWLRTGPPDDATGPKRVAVLPFENLGRPEDEYFTDGLPMRCGASSPDSRVCRSSPKQLSSVQESSQEPAADRGRARGQYLLTGTVRWERAGRVSAAYG